MAGPDEKQQRIVDARMKLRDRFFAKMKATPGVADGKPLGSGPPNRHGMPQVPIGQHVTDGWPVLDLGSKPEISFEEWRLRVDGAVESPITLTWKDFLELPQVDDISDFHCVTTWSKLDVPWKGVPFATIAALVRPLPTATHVLVHAAEGKPLPQEHGGPVRMITPQLYAWKGSKWISRIEFLTHDRPGFWETRGYSNSAHPWRDDRYS